MRRFAQREEALVWISLDVELASGPVLHQFDQVEHVDAANVALVRARMHGKPVGAGRQGETADLRDTRPGQVTAIAQMRDGVEIDGKRGHGFSLHVKARRLNSDLWS